MAIVRRRQLKRRRPLSDEELLRRAAVSAERYRRRLERERQGGQGRRAQRPLTARGAPGQNNR